MSGSTVDNKELKAKINIKSNSSDCPAKLKCTAAGTTCKEKLNDITLK